MSGNTMDLATAAESAFVMWAVGQGFEVSRPIHHAQGYDFVIRRKEYGYWETVQCKAAYNGQTGRRKPCRVVSLRRCNEKGNRPYIEGDFDWLFVWDGMEYMWFMPWSEVKDIKSNLTISNAEKVNRAKYMVKMRY